MVKFLRNPAHISALWSFPLRAKAKDSTARSLKYTQVKHIQDTANYYVIDPPVFTVYHVKA